MIDTSGWRPWRRYLCVAYRPNDGPPQTFAALLARIRAGDAYVDHSPTDGGTPTWARTWCSEAGAMRRCKDTIAGTAVWPRTVWPRIALEVSRAEITLAELAEVR